MSVSMQSVAGNPLGLKGLVHVVRLLLSNVTIQGLSLSGELVIDFYGRSGESVTATVSVASW